MEHKSHVKRQLKIYEGAAVAPNDMCNFYICWQDDTTEERGFCKSSYGGSVRLEKCESWLEAHEEASHMNFHDVEWSEYDGNTYFISDYLGNPILPPYAEMKESIQYVRKQGESLWSWSEKFAGKLLFGWSLK